MISIELDYLANQIDSHVGTLAAPPATVNRRHHHSNREGSITRQRQMLTEKVGALGTYRLPRESVLIAQDAAFRVPEVLWQTVEHQGSVSRHSGQRAQPIARFGAKLSEGLSQAHGHYGCLRAAARLLNVIIRALQIRGAHVPHITGVGRRVCAAAYIETMGGESQAALR